MGGFFSKLIEFCTVSTEINDIQNIHIEFDEEETISDITDVDNILLEENDDNAIFTLSNEKKALVIGINYNEDQFKGNDLNGCVNDMNNLVSFLHTKCFFLKEDVQTLCNSEASRKNIENELTKLVVFSHQNPGSEIWLSYSGHGSNVTSLTEEDSKSEVICPSDYASNGIITDSWIQHNFVQGLEKTTKVFVLMDCCNSGSNLNLPYRYQYADVTSNDSSYTVDELVNLCNIVKISGCEDDQTSADYFERKDNEFQGALTNGFLHSPNGSDKDIIHFYNNILSYLISRGFTQRPVLSFSNGKLLNSRLC
jgi:metacaspase-1